MLPIKLGTRLTVALAVPIALLIAVFGLVQTRVNRERLQQELEREGRVITRSIQIAIENALRDRQTADVRRLVEEIAESDRVLGIRYLDARGAVQHESAIPGNRPAVSPERLREALLGSGPVESRLHVDGAPAVSFLAPLRDPSGASLGAVEVLQLQSFIEEDARASRAAVAALTVALILAAAIVVFFVTRVSVTRPIEELVRSFRDVGSGDLQSRVPVRRRDELGRLTEEFNAMCARLDAAHRSLLDEQGERRRIEEDLRRSEHLASIGRFSAALAHEIGTPLNVIGGRAELMLRRGVRGEAAARDVRIIAAQIDRITRIVRGMLDFARGRELRWMPTRPRDVIAKVIELMEHRHEQSGIAVEERWPEGLPPIWADADQLQEVFLNLALNAADAMPDGGVLRIDGRLERRSRPAGEAEMQAFLAVGFQDSGHGIQPEHLDHVFEPFFTTKEVGEGTGLGLAISYGIVKEHGGWIEVESRSGRGTLVTVYLPLSRADCETAPMEVRTA